MGLFLFLLFFCTGRKTPIYLLTLSFCCFVVAVVVVVVLCVCVLLLLLFVLVLFSFIGVWQGVRGTRHETVTGMGNG